MARPALGKVRFMASLPPGLLERLDAFAGRESKTRAELIQLALENFLPSEPKPIVQQVSPTKRIIVKLKRSK